MKNSVALIGFMGAGKTTVGRELATRLRMEFIDVDALIMKRAARSISEIFAFDGETAFRRMEADAILQAVSSPGRVIACGGGAILNPANIVAISQCCRVVYLSASLPVLTSRALKSTGHRPLLNTVDPVSAIEDLYRYRMPLYEKAADIIIDTSQEDIAAVTDRICKELERK